MLDVLKAFPIAHIRALISQGAATAGHMVFRDNGCQRDWWTREIIPVEFTEIIHFFNHDGDEVGFLSTISDAVMYFDPPRVWHAEAKRRVKLYSLTAEAIGGDMSLGADTEDGTARQYVIPLTGWAGRTAEITKLVKSGDTVVVPLPAMAAAVKKSIQVMKGEDFKVNVVVKKEER